MQEKRPLTEHEIDFILDFITPNARLPSETANAIVAHQKSRLRAQLVKATVFPRIIPKLKAEIELQFARATIAPGECVGIVCAQSIGHILTQKTLDSFHSAGRTEMTTVVGVPRCKQLLLATTKPSSKMSRVYFNGANTADLASLRDAIGHSMVGLTLGDVTLAVFATLDKSPEPWYEVFELLYGDLYGSRTDGGTFQHCVEVKLDTTKMFEFRLTAADLAQALVDEYGDVAVVFSPPELAELHIYYNTDDMWDLPAERASFADTEEAPLIYLEEVVIPILEKQTLVGISGINNIFFTNRDGEWLAETDGTNLQGLMAHPLVDEHRTVSSNVWDIYNVLGIEAAREFLFEEFSGVMDGINTCHPMLLVDRMTHGGMPASISRYTLRNEELGALGKASFEESMKNFEDAAFVGGKEHTRGVSASTICGKMAQIGTGMPKILIDTSKLPEVAEEDLPESMDEQTPVLPQPNKKTAKVDTRTETVRLKVGERTSKQTPVPPRQPVTKKMVRKPKKVAEKVEEAPTFIDF